MATIALAGPPAAEKQGQFSFRSESGLPSLRRDLHITQVSYRRRRNWVVKDPSSLRYFRWGEWDYRVAKLLDGKRQLEEITAELSRSLGAEVDPLQVRLTINNMLGAGLLLSNGTVARRLYESQREAARKKKNKTWFLSVASKLISFKFTLFDPDLLLLRMSKKLRFLWAPGALVVLLLMLASSAWLMLANWASLGERMPDILGWENLLILWLVMITVKVVHEFGHGLACKHFGGEVHEMGAMFILFSPFLFCNASDSWTFRDKKQRLVVTFAGIYLELFLAAVAAALWVLTQPGLFNQLCFNVMLVCSVMTVFFNANPLMKFDGYYALSDWMEIPNLKERGDRTLVSAISGLLTGGRGVVVDPLTARVRARVMLYAVASYLWTFTVAFRMLLAIGIMLEPYGLDRLAQALASLVLLTGIVAPPIMVALYVRKIILNDNDPSLRRLVLRRGLIAAAILVVLLAIPWSVNVHSSCVIEAVDRARITAASAGFVSEVTCSDGRRVAEGDVLAKLENPELERQVINYELRSAELQAAVAAVETDPDYRNGLSGLRLQAEQVGTALKQAQFDREQMTLRSPIAGVVSGRGLRERAGTLLRRGDLLCEVLPEGTAGAIVVLGENEAGKIALGQTVAFRLSSFAGQTFSGKVLAITEQPIARLPHQSLGQYAGGTVPGVMSTAPGSNDPRNIEAVPTGQVFSVKVAIDDDKGLLRPGMSGRIKIHCGRRPLGLTLWDNFTSMLRTDFRL